MKKVVKCTNGVCEERTSLGRLPTHHVSAKHEGRRNMSHVMMEGGSQGAGKIRSDWFDGSISRAVDGMVDAMRDTRNIFGQQTMDQMLDDMFKSTSDRGGKATDIMRSPVQFANANSTSSESVSAETVFQNGHLVKRTTICHNGNCTTSVERRNATRHASPKVNASYKPTMM